MAQYLSALVPSSCAAWYNLAEVTAAGAVTTLKDVSGYGRDLSGPATSKPNFVLNAVGTKPAVRFASGNNPLTWTPSSGSVNIKDLVILCKYVPASGSVFTDYVGLVSNTSTDDPLLIGNSGTANFYDYDPPAPADNAYRKDWVFYAETAMAAPVNSFGVVQYSQSAGQTFTTSTGLQIGKDRALAAPNDDRRWTGDIAEMMFFTSVLTDDERRRVKLYFDLKYGRWRTDNTALEFPDPTLTGIHWARHYALPAGWGDVTIEHKYEDEGISLSHTTDTPPKRWEVEFNGLTASEAEVFDAFNDAARRSRSFSFKDSSGTTHTGVRIVEYNRTHEGNRSWSSTVNFTLAKYY